MKYAFHITIFILLWISGGGLVGQNIETITTIPKPGLSGGINVGTQFYGVDGRTARRSPFSYVISGNTRFKWGLLNVPVSFSFRDQNLSYGTSFNKFGMSPYYKWARLHLGHRSMRFNRYSLSGKNFFGVGMDLTPGKFRLSAFRGNIRNHLAQRDTLVFGANLVPTYTRKAYGVKVGYGSSKNYFDVVYLRVRDDRSDEFPDRQIAISQLDPADNLVVGTSWRLQIMKRLNMTGSLNASAYTENASLRELNGDEGLVKAFGGLTTINASTKASVAGDMALNLNLNSAQVGLSYRRIEPNYRSLGTPFIQADVESYMANTSLRMLNNKLIFSANAGLERNNLRNLDYLGRKRLIASLQANVIPNTGTNINLYFTNFQYENVDGLVELNDTLRYVQVNRSLGGNINYNPKKEDFDYGAFLTINRMVVEDQSPIQVINSDIVTFTSNVGLNLEWTLLELSVKPSFLYNQFNLTDDKQQSYGLGLSVGKTFFEKKLRTRFRTRFNYNDRNGKRDGRVISARVGINYKVTDLHSFNMNLGIMDRNSIVRQSYREVRSNIGYGLRF